tara:strand:- start:11095 stop:11568 length:474 start_codon:yes stop_codon:yes gene_type:complete
MDSKQYKLILSNAYRNRELTPEDFDNTLNHYTMLVNQENGLTEEDGGTEYGVESDEFDKIMPVVGPRLKDGDTVNISANESTIKEDDKEDKDTSEIDALYSGADDRAIEYGMQSEDFDKLMEELKESGRPTIKVNENRAINARIKKGDLISYIKNKK